MGMVGTQLLKMDPNEVIALLNQAFADEWLAYYQYWIGTKVVKGPMKESLITELTQHAADELRHADLLSNRIIQLGGTPLLKPDEWLTYSHCGYEAPDNPYITFVLNQNIKGEQCAIKFYQNVMDITKDKDMVTYDLVFRILQDEVEHEEDLQAIAEDIELMLKNIK